MNVFSETAIFGLVNQGGHTAFLDCGALMATHPDLEVMVNARARCDVLHSHSWGPLFFAWGARRWAGGRIFTAHAVPETAIGALPFGHAAQPLIRWYLRMVCDFADVVVAVAPGEAEVIRAMGVSTPVAVVCNPIRADRFVPSAALRAEGRRLLRLTDDRPVVLGVGQIQPRKGVSEFAAVALAIPEAHFIWVGGRPFGLVSAGLSQLNRLMARPPANLTFAGMFDIGQMPAVYNTARVMLFPSSQENCPYAPMEAASCSVPVVFRDLAEYRALYRTEYLKAASASDMTVAVRRLLSSEGEWNHWVAASRCLSDAFRAADFVATTARLYDEQACIALDDGRLR